MKNNVFLFVFIRVHSWFKNLFSWMRRHKTRSVFLFLLLVASFINRHVRDNMGRAPNAEDIARFQASPNFVDGKFKNRHDRPNPIDTEPRPPRLSGILKFLFSNEGHPDTPPPVVKLTRADFQDPLPLADFRVTWLGHATLLIELDGIRILTDPVFDSVSPIPGTVRRFGPPPLPRKELPPIDFVLISHDHYDHLDAATVRYLARKGETYFYVPLGVGARLRGWGVPERDIFELDWFQSSMYEREHNWFGTNTYNRMDFTAVPAHHRSGRTFRDARTTLWASWIIEGAERKIFFGGDGGYDEDFALMGEMYGPFDIAALGVGAYDERWAANHLFPEEAVLAAQELRAAKLLPIHWGAYRLAPHPWDEPILRTIEAAEKENMPLINLKPGEYHPRAR